MQKVFLIYPPSVVMNREDRCQQPVEELITIPPLPPQDLMYLAAIARNEGYFCKIKDYSIKSETTEQLQNDLEEFQPDYLIVNVATPTLESDLMAFKIAKSTLPNITTIAKGAYFLTKNIEVLNSHPELDLIIRGESEFTLKEILQKRPYNEILGLTYRENGMPQNNEMRPFIEDLDEIPFPARELVNMEIYRRPDNNKKQATIKVSRGCPFHCFFCLATPVSGSKVRKRSAENIIAEIKECIEKYGVKNFLFWSDIFDLDREWTVNLCNKLIEAKLGIVWSSNTRADTADFELAKLMYKSGCRLVSIGVESGSQFMLDKMGKKTNLAQIEKTVKDFQRAKIKVYNYFVLGLPWESMETAEETIKFAIKLNSDYVNFYTATVFPGSRFWDYAIENKLIENEGYNENRYKSAYYYPSVNTHYLSKEQVFNLHKQAVKRYYLRPAFIWKTFVNIRSLTEFVNYAKSALKLILKK